MDLKLVGRSHPSTGVKQTVAKLGKRTTNTKNCDVLILSVVKISCFHTRKNILCWRPFPESLLRQPNLMNSYKSDRKQKQRVKLLKCSELVN